MGDQVPFSLLLQQPWQHENYVQIQEQIDDTHLEFEAPKIRELLHKILVRTTFIEENSAIAQTYMLTAPQTLKTCNIPIQNGENSISHHLINQSRALIQPVASRLAQNSYFQNNGEHVSSTFGNKHSLKNLKAIVYSLEDKSDKENTPLKIGNNRESERQCNSRQSVHLKRERLTNLSKPRKKRPIPIVQQLTNQVRKSGLDSLCAQRHNNIIGARKNYKSQVALLQNHGLAMTQPSPHYHFPSHPRLQDTQMLRNGLIWHPQTGTVLQPAFILVSSTQGVITDLSRDVRIANQYYAQIILPRALFTCHMRDEQTVMVTGCRFLCLHHNGQNSEMTRAASLMTVDPASPFGPRTNSWQVYGNFPHHFHQISPGLLSVLPPATTHLLHVIAQLPPSPQLPSSFQPLLSNVLNQLLHLPVLYFVQAKPPEDSTLIEEVPLNPPNPPGAWNNDDIAQVTLQYPMEWGVVNSAQLGQHQWELKTWALSDRTVGAYNTIPEPRISTKNLWLSPE